MKDENDHTPSFEATHIELTVSESAREGHLLHTFAADDKDAGLNAAVRYSLGAAAHRNAFQLDPVTGALIVGSRLDR